MKQTIRKVKSCDGVLVMSYEPGYWGADYSGSYYSPDMWRFSFEGGHAEVLVFGTRYRDCHWDLSAYLSWLEDPNTYGVVEECSLAWAQVWWDEVPNDMPMKDALSIAVKELETAYLADPSITDWPEYRSEAFLLLAWAAESA